jgi:hypothetical protein
MKKALYEIIETAIGTYTVKVLEPGRRTYLHDGFRSRDGAEEWIEQQRQMAVIADRWDRTPIGRMYGDE